ncbi:pre-rRNA 2'-O-ribose RNA methyltransferase FTSJ3 [Oratosquilla oratoria]|uniref:pre-rRNA 2'-O-ribose RNA methyltransferase FTSJ3 n=1 Tax=Oratosquilla oratoria TaxID=337810 RepID=UPI003F76537B
MPRKVKKGKNRLDVFYKRAKEAGYRARAAYKLIQLNTKYEFLQKSRVCIDLCAAPGSWMQVASKFMPVSSIIVGVDLIPIKPIPNTIAFQGDITTEKVRKELQGTLKTWKADLVLHDGAPNVGQNWIHDAYQQNLLVLQSFKLACEFLQKGGWFISKVFRSKDYFSLEYCFRKLFKKVEATKPQASRYESAEIFVVCQGYLAPAKVDPQFFDPKHVFQEVDPEPKAKLNVLKPEKVSKKAEGYAEGATILYNKVPVSNFVESTNFIEVLQDASELYFDNEFLRDHKLTSNEIKSCCADIKVLGRRDIKLLMNWRKKIKPLFDESKKEVAEPAEDGDADMNGEDEEGEDDQEDDLDEEEKELDEIQEQIEAMKTEKAREEKKERRRVQKEKKKLEERLKLKAIIPGDTGPHEAESHGLFNLKTLAKVQNLDTVVDQEADELIESSDDEENLPKPKYIRVKYSKDGGYLDKSGQYYKNTHDENSEEEVEKSDDEVESLGLEEAPGKTGTNEEDSDDAEQEDDEEAGDETPNVLLTDLVGDEKEGKKARKAEKWFSKDIFDNIESEAVEDFELHTVMKSFSKKGGTLKSKEPDIIDKEKEKKVAKKVNGEAEKAVDAPDSGEDGEDDSDSDSDTDEEYDDKKGLTPAPKFVGGCLDKDGNLMGDRRNMNKRSLDPTTLALASKFIQSKKSRRDIMDAAWNRYMFGDEDDLPDWFVKDEKKFNRAHIEVEKEDLQLYRDRAKAVDARTIKKVVEAKARKKRRVKKRMDRAKKKAEVITDNLDMTEREKAMEVKKLYKKAMAPAKDKEIKYVVMKKRFGGSKPKGVKGRYKMVDKRLKKDARSQKAIAKKK